MAANHSSSGVSQLALNLGGGGARAAYQVGALRAIAKRHPHLRVPLLTGVSAGAINTSVLANSTGTFEARVEKLTELWKRLKLENVFEIATVPLLWRAAKIGMRLTVGLPKFLGQVHGMVDTRPLGKYLREALSSPDGKLPGIERNIQDGTLDAVALTANSYETGDTVTFFHGRQIEAWDRPHRHGVESAITVDHVMASSALPLLFPPVRIGSKWYGDGGVRLLAPLAPSVHLGADRMFVISTHFAGEEIQRPPAKEAPSPATVLAAMYNAVFLDQLDQDERELRRINQLIGQIPQYQPGELKHIGLFVMRPSQDLGAIAFELKDRLPRTLRYLLKRLGSGQPGSDDFLSTLMFNTEYTQRLIEIGERDVEAQADRISEFLQ